MLYGYDIILLGNFFLYTRHFIQKNYTNSFLNKKIKNAMVTLLNINKFTKFVLSSSNIKTPYQLKTSYIIEVFVYVYN